MKLKMPDGTTVEAQRMESTPVREDWNLYKLTDGTIIRLRITATDIFRLETIDEVTGQHHYYVRHNTIVAANEPEK